MGTATLEQPVTAEIVAKEVRLDQAKLPAVIVVKDEATHAAALMAVRLRKQFVKDTKAKFEPVCSAAHKAWTATTDLRGSVIDPVEEEISTLSKAIFAYEAEVKRREAEAQRLIDEAARKAEEETKAANEVLMPWEQDEVRDVAVAVTEAVRVTELRVAETTPKLATVEGVGSKNKPWQGRVTDLRKFLAWCASIESDDRLELYFALKGPALNQLAKKVTDTGTIPGFEGFREKTISL